MTPDPMKCLVESKRVLRDGGILSCSSWQENQWMGLMELAKTVRPDMEMFSIPKAWTEKDGVRGELEKAGFKDVDCQQVDVEMKFDSHDGFLEFLLTKMPHMNMMLESFSEEDRVRLRSEMMKKLKEMSPQEPGRLKGTTLVAVGRK